MTRLPSLNPKLELGHQAKEILESFGIDVPIAPYDFITDAKLVSDPSTSSAISDQILDRMFPRSDPCEALHYTGATTLQSIVSGKQLWLAWVQKNIDCDEYTTFADDHGYSGYFQIDPKGKHVYEHITRSMYYASFTPAAMPNNDDLWQTFGNDEHCLRFRIEPRPVAQFRRMQYQDGHPTLLKEIDAAFRARVQRIFLPRRISQLCAFYLTQSFKGEDELRLLIPNPPPERTFDHAGDTYIAIPIGAENDMCRLDLLEVYCGSQALVDPTRELLDREGFSTVKVSLRPGL
jgi:hypothetical protein